MDVPATVALPKWAEIIDCRDLTMIRKYGMDGPTSHVGSLLNSPGEVTADAIIESRAKRAGVRDKEFVGIDLFPGLNVDVVADLCAADFPETHPNLIGHFGLVMCSALLEHVENPFAASKNIAHLLRPGGHLLFSGPWVQGYHAYPGDFWRISFDGLTALFPSFEWKEWWYSGNKKGVGIKIRDKAYERKLFQIRGIDGPGSLLTDRAMPYLNIGAVGQKPKAP